MSCPAAAPRPRWPWRTVPPRRSEAAGRRRLRRRRQWRRRQWRRWRWRLGPAVGIRSAAGSRCRRGSSGGGPRPRWRLYLVRGGVRARIRIGVVGRGRVAVLRGVLTALDRVRNRNRNRNRNPRPNPNTNSDPNPNPIPSQWRPHHTRSRAARTPRSCPAPAARAARPGRQH